MELKTVDPEELSFDEGSYLVRLSRGAVEEYFGVAEATGYELPSEKLERPGAAFVTIEAFSGKARSLRGCIGYIKPVKPLYLTVKEVALQAAFNDPRFPPMRKEELDNVTFEVSVLSDMEKAPSDRRERKNFVKIGRDGLLVVYGLFSGLLLPQVPVEYGWSVEEFLSETCVKAGLPWDCWFDSKVDVYRFRARIWRELKPKGELRSGTSIWNG
ncbi:MAG: AmmeMemoRadiSam system protein A [Desulfurococcales archaeon]|nr:AmmeMemoRadiSam system protein A [Desulfurococcales archaeon]